MLCMYIHVLDHLQVHNHSKKMSNAAIWQRIQRRVVSCRVRASMEYFGANHSDGDGSERSRSARRGALSQAATTHDSRSDLGSLLDETAPDTDQSVASTTPSTMDEAASDPETSVISEGGGDQPVLMHGQHAGLQHDLQNYYLYTPSLSSSVRSTSFGSLGWGSDVDIMLTVYSDNIIDDDDKITWVSHDFGASDSEKEGEIV